MNNSKKTEETVKTNLARTTKIVATYVGRGQNQQQGHKNYGKKFFKYNLTGPESEIKEFINDPSNQEYGIKYDSDGVTPQYWCNWKDPFGTKGTRYNVNVSMYGTYVLDKQDSYDIEDTLEELEKRGLHTTARVYAETILSDRMGLGLSRSNVNRLAMAPSDGTGANLSEE